MRKRIREYWDKHEERIILAFLVVLGIVQVVMMAVMLIKGWFR